MNTPSPIPAALPRTGVLIAALLPLTLLTGCGSPDSTPRTSASASTTPPASTALTAAQLAKLSLTTSDLTGFTTREPAAHEKLTQNDVRPAEADCAPVNQARWGVALGSPAATAHRRIDSELDQSAIDAATTDAEFDAALAVTNTTVTLASYDTEAQAKTALKSLRDSIGTCEGGFSSFSTGKVIPHTAPDAGDEAVAFTTTAGEGDALGPTNAVVFRHGSTLAQLTTVNANAVFSDDWDFPAVLVETQAAKLR